MVLVPIWCNGQSVSAVLSGIDYPSRRKGCWIHVQTCLDRLGNGGNTVEFLCHKLD